MNAYIENDAIFSDCGRYRYLLRRTWDQAKPRALFVMLNPSTANANRDDPTIRSCVRLVKALGYGSVEVVNLFGLISADPGELLKASDPIGPGNEHAVQAAVTRCAVVILAWGAFQIAAERSQFFCEWIRAVQPQCFGKTKAGAPKHPLYIKTGTPLEVFA